MVALEGRTFQAPWRLQRSHQMSIFKKCIEFHGIIVRGLAIGFQAARALMDHWREEGTDEELVALVETDACGADCHSGLDRLHFWQRKFHLPELWEHAFHWQIEERANRSGRACGQIPFRQTPSTLSFRKVRTETASRGTGAVRNLQRNGSKDLESHFESLFKIEEISLQFRRGPDRRIKTCDYCGELTKADCLAT